MNAAEEHARRGMVQRAFEMLLRGEAGLITRAELFKDFPASAKFFQRKIYTAMTDQGLVEKYMGGDPRSPVTYIRVKDRPRVEQILKEPAELTRFIWPGSAPPVISESAEIVALPPLTDELNMTTDQLLRRLLVVMETACLSIIHTRNKLDTLEPKILELHKIWVTK